MMSSTTFGCYSEGDQLNLMRAVAAWKFRKWMRLFAVFGSSCSCSLRKLSPFQVRLPLSALIAGRSKSHKAWDFVATFASGSTCSKSASPANSPKQLAGKFGPVLGSSSRLKGR